jgi:hypothetical protein
LKISKYESLGLYFTEPSFCLRVFIPNGSLPSGWSSLPYLTGSLGLPIFPSSSNSDFNLFNSSSTFVGCSTPVSLAGSTPCVSI